MKYKYVIVSQNNYGRYNMILTSEIFNTKKDAVKSLDLAENDKLFIKKVKNSDLIYVVNYEYITTFPRTFIHCFKSLKEAKKCYKKYIDEEDCAAWITACLIEDIVDNEEN